MAAVLEAGVLARAMARAAAVVERRNTIPILANVRLEAAGDSLTLETTDLDMTYQQRLPLAAPLDGALATTVDAGRLAALAGAVDGGAQIRLALDDRTRLTVTAGRSRWQLPAIPVDDFPRLVAGELPEPAAMPARALGEALKRVSPAICTEATRYYLNGVFLDQDAGKTMVVATDGTSLLRAALPMDWPEWPVEQGGPIVPRKFVAQAITLCGTSEAAASLCWGARTVRLALGDVVLTSKLIDGSFPEYRRVIPEARSDAARLDPELARAALRRVQLVSNERDRKVRLERGAGQVVLSIATADSGTAREEVAADCAEGFECGFNARYLADMLEAIGGDSVELHHESAGAPCLIRRVVDDGALAVIMPMRL